MTDGGDDEPFIYRMNDNGSGPSLLMKVCIERGWRSYQGYSSSGEEKWNLWWRTSAFSAASYKTLGDWQFMNHIPKGGSICRKDNLSRHLRCMRKIYGSIYDFSPPSYHLPLEYAKLVSECCKQKRLSDDGGSNVVWIHKPVAQSQGRGIFLFRSIGDMRCGSAAVVQRYIERPLLIAGYKFDLRLYVCVPTYRPLTAYLYAEGLARFGTDKYTLSDIHNPYRHLTNSSLNKSGPRYAECKDRIGNGCKWTLRQVRHALVSRWGASEWLVWQRVRALVTLTLLAQATGTPAAANCFEFYGFDVLLDDSLKPWLLEVNLSPALASDCEADVVVKRPMLHEMFDLLGLPMRHTGLALLQGPLILINSASEDESETPPIRATKSANKKSHKKRQTLPLNFVNLQPPMNDFLEQREINQRASCLGMDNSSDMAEDQSSTSSEASKDDIWRNPLPSLDRKRPSNTSSNLWGNGVRWDRAPGRCGLWVRIFPHVTPQNDQMQIDDVREAVAQVSKLNRAAKEVARDCSYDSRDLNRDANFGAQLRSRLGFGPHFEVWIPPL